MSPFVWLAVAAVAAVAEVLSLGLITLWFVVGALVAFVANLLGVDDLVQIVVFLVVSVACLVLLRPVFVKYRKHGAREEPTLVGQPVVVCEDIDNDRMVGRVETGDHMTWCTSRCPSSTACAAASRSRSRWPTSRRSPSSRATT